MRKNIGLIMLASSMALNCLGQVTQPPALTKSVNNTIFQQVLNDFDRRIPLVFFVPGFFFIGSIQVNNNIFFNETDFYEETEMPDLSEFTQQIVSNAIGSNLIPYIPKDSVMKVRIMDNNNLIIEMEFHHTEDTLFFNLTNGSREKIKSISYFNDKVLATSYTDARKGINYSSRLYGDTLRKSLLHNDERLITTNIIYDDGYISTISTFKRNPDTKKDDLKKTERFLYNENHQLFEKKYFNPRDKMTRMIQYYYKGDTLVQYNINQGTSVVLTVTNDYSSKDNSLLKTYYGSDFNYSRVHYFKESDDLNVEFEKSRKTEKRRYILKSDVNQRLSELEYRLIQPDSPITKTKKRWVFNYNAMGNLSSIKVINKKGNIKKHILLEYSFLRP